MLTLTALLATLALLTVSNAHGRPIPAKLAAQARHLAAHGGVTGSCHGCAIPRMRQFVRRMIRIRFQDSGRRAVRIALCVARGESGFNPGAISRTGDYGVFQINRATWFATYDWRRILDPAYNIGVGWAMSRQGRNWHPWVVYQRGYCT